MSPILPTHAATLPVIGISTNVRLIGDHSFHAVAEPFINAVFEASGCLPVLLPALGERYDYVDLASRLDGLLLTGGDSHVAPMHYGEDDRTPHNHDFKRDATTLPMIRVAVNMGVPIFAICRGMQELNVALGGTLHQEHKTSGKFDHNADRALPMGERLAKLHHQVTLQDGGKMLDLVQLKQFEVNSAHEQSIAALSPALQAEALAEDGVIEAVSHRTSSAFTMGVQWHPEAHIASSDVSQKLFGAFGQAARTRLAQRMLKSDWERSIAEDGMINRAIDGGR